MKIAYLIIGLVVLLALLKINYEPEDRLVWWDSSDPHWVAKPSMHFPGTEIWVSREGNDSNPGSEELPLRTIKKAASLAEPGDSILVKSGLYEEDNITFSRSGEKDRWIHLVSADGYGKAVIDSSFVDIERGTKTGLASIWIGNRSYIAIEGFEIRNHPSNNLFVKESDNIYIADNYFHGAGKDGVKISYNSAYIYSIHNFFEANDDEDLDYMMTENGVISHNFFYESKRVSSFSKGGCINMKVRYNLFHSPSGVECAYYIGGDSGGQFFPEDRASQESYNEDFSYNIVFRSPDSGLCVKGAKNATIHYNLFIDSGEKCCLFHFWEGNNATNGTSKSVDIKMFNNTVIFTDKLPGGVFSLGKGKEEMITLNENNYYYSKLDLGSVWSHVEVDSRSLIFCNTCKKIGQLNQVPDRERYFEMWEKFSRGLI
ncbi:right-handed parallel beta-helix repeat-containing protein [Candidatus Woesearchaeota archaeon]|nr:right-handed parallel beta-helix repeat-containing protein [Candidatus Woesearchaeota archaeon]